MKIDPHTHILPEPWPGRRIEDCDDTGVTLQVPSTVPVMFSYWAKPGDGHDLSRILHDHIAGVVAERPDRFVGLATVGAERIALGSDYPFPLGEAQPGALIESMGDLSKQTKDRLLFETASEFLALERT